MPPGGRDPVPSEQTILEVAASCGIIRTSLRTLAVRRFGRPEDRLGQRSGLRQGRNIERKRSCTVIAILAETFGPALAAFAYSYESHGYDYSDDGSSTVVRSVTRTWVRERELSDLDNSADQTVPMTDPEAGWSDSDQLAPDAGAADDNGYAMQPPPSQTIEPYAAAPVAPAYPYDYDGVAPPVHSYGYSPYYVVPAYPYYYSYFPRPWRWHNWRDGHGYRPFHGDPYRHRPVGIYGDHFRRGGGYPHVNNGYGYRDRGRVSDSGFRRPGPPNRSFGGTNNFRGSPRPQGSRSFNAAPRSRSGGSAPRQNFGRSGGCAPDRRRKASLNPL